MANFSIKFSYTKDQVIYHKTAIVRASSPDMAKDKLVNSLSRITGETYESFAFVSISLSSHNFIVV